MDLTEVSWAEATVIGLLMCTIITLAILVFLGLSLLGSARLTVKRRIMMGGDHDGDGDGGDTGDTRNRASYVRKP
jgi:hypothetical protein